MANKISVAKNTSIDLPTGIAGAEFAHQDIVPSSSNSRIEIPLSLATATGKSSVQGVAVNEEIVERTPHPALSIRASVGTFWRQGGWGIGSRSDGSLEKYTLAQR